MLITKRSDFYPHREHACEIPCTPAQLAAWRAGQVVQRAMPMLTREEREFLMTGTTPDEWLAAFGPEDEEDWGASWVEDEVTTANDGFLAYRAHLHAEDTGDYVTVGRPGSGACFTVQWGCYSDAGPTIGDAMFRPTLTEVLPTRAMAIARARGATLGQVVQQPDTRTADRIDGYDRDDLGESPDY